MPRGGTEDDRDDAGEPDVVREAATGLYRLHPGEFVSARDERARSLKESGDRAGATGVAALRRPTVGAWLVNLLVESDPDLATGLRELAGSLRAAQDELDGAALRGLGEQRHRLVSELVGRARALARDAGHPPGEAALVEVEGSLRAALTDPSVADEVLSGRLLRAVDATGFGGTAPAAPAGRAPRRGGRSGRSKQVRRAGKEPSATAAEKKAAADLQAAMELRDAEAALATAEEERASAADAERRTAEERTAARDRARTAEQEVRAAQEAVGRAREEVKAADREHEAARRRARESTKAAAGAARKAARLREG